MKKTEHYYTKQSIMEYLEAKGNPDSKHIYMNHGAKEPFFNVKIADMKPIVKKIKKDYELSLQLWQTGNSDAMYLAGLIADESKMTKNDFENWINTAYWYMLSECSVAWPAAEHENGWEMAMEWIKNDNPRFRQVGWATASGVIMLKDKEIPDPEVLDNLINYIENNLQIEENRVKYVMNGFLIALGGYLPEYKDKTIEASNNIGKFKVDMGGTACKVPHPPTYLQKMYAREQWKKPKKTVRC
jgi:3-methyladenine DNA glycosylase AlkD